MTNPAVVDDIAARWRPLTDAEVILATAYLGDAWVLLKRRIPTLETNIDTDDDLKADVVRVEAQMVLRVLKNPDGVQETSVTVDDASRTWKRSGDSGSGLLYITDMELDELWPGRSTAAFSIRQVAAPFCGPSSCDDPMYADLSTWW